MRLLADSCVRGRTIRALRAAGHDVEAVADWGGDPGDADILECARRATRVLLTVDKDFGILVFRHRQPHTGVLYSRMAVSAAAEAERLLSVLSAYAAQLEAGEFLTVDTDRVKVGPSP